jgi:hypothetical protein
MSENTIESVPVQPDLMGQLLDAAMATAFAHRDAPGEMYALGQMEATANMVYVMIVGQGFNELENQCQRVATEAITRLQTLRDRDQQSEVWRKRIQQIISRVG